MFFGDSKGFLGHLRDFLDFQGSLGFSLNSQGSSDFFSRFLGWCTRFLLVIHPSGRRVREKAEKKKTWYVKGGCETVLFVDSKLNSELAKQCQKALREAKLKICVVERGGQSLKQALVRSNPINENN